MQHILYVACAGINSTAFQVNCTRIFARRKGLEQKTTNDYTYIFVYSHFLILRQD